MEKKILLVLVLLVAVPALVLVGCSGKEETPPADNTHQTPALVPGSVGQGHEPEVVEPTVEAPREVSEPQAGIPEEPQTRQPAPVVKKIESSPEKPILLTQPPVVFNGGLHSLQLGSFRVSAVAEEKATQLQDLGYPATVEQAEVRGLIYYRVLIRGLADRQSAKMLGEELHSSLGFSYLIKRK